MGIRSLVTLHPRAAAPAVLALLVLFQPHRHSSSSSSSTSSASSSSLFVSFLLRSGSLSSLALVLAPARASASFASLRLSSLATPLSARSRPWSLPAARTLYPLPPRPRGNAPPKNIDPVSTTRFMFCGRERTLTSSSRPVPSRHCLLRLVPLLLFLPLLTPPGINQPRCVPFRSRPSSKHLDKLRAEKLIGGPRKRACAPKRCARRTNQRVLEVRRRIDCQKRTSARRWRMILISGVIYFATFNIDFFNMR